MGLALILKNLWRMVSLRPQAPRCGDCGPDADIGPCPRLAASCPVARPLEAPEVVTFLAPWNRKPGQQTLGYRMNLLYRAQLRLREAGWNDLADEVDALHGELWFWNVGMKYPPESRCIFKPESPHE